MKNIIKIISNIAIIIALFLNFVSGKFNNNLVLLLLSVFLVINLLTNGYRCQNKRNIGKVYLIISICCLLFLSIFYFMGIGSEFNRNFMFIPYKLIKTDIWVSVFVSVLFTELVRYVATLDIRGNKISIIIQYLLLLTLFVLVDINIAQKNVYVSSFNSIYDFFSLILCPSISKNVFLIWVSKKYGYTPCLLYRLIIDLYVYYIPYVPNNNHLIQSCMFVLLPYIIYCIVDNLDAKRELPKVQDRFKRSLSNVETIVLLIIFGILTCLVSRAFDCSMIAVGSESMTGTINKGDAIIYKKYNGEILHEGDIVVFDIDGKLIVHRITRRFYENDNYMFITKGDANSNEDNWIVDSNMIVGRVVQRVRYIAWPSVWINEKF